MNNASQQMYIIRGEHSGVFFGEVISRRGREVEIGNCRRLWYWDGAASLSQIANEGVKRPENCKFTVAVDRITVLDAIEILACTEAAIENIRGVPEWRR